MLGTNKLIKRCLRVSPYYISLHQFGDFGPLEEPIILYGFKVDDCSSIIAATLQCDYKLHLPEIW